MTSPSVGWPKIFSTSLEKTQSWPCRIRARGRTTMPDIAPTVGQPHPLPNSEWQEERLPDKLFYAYHACVQMLNQIDLPGIKKLRSGKVREVFDLGDTLLFVVSDRL